MSGRRTMAAGLISGLGYAASRGLDIDELCDVVGVDAAELTDPLRMLPFAYSERLWQALMERLPDENIGLGIAGIGRPESYGLLFQYWRYVQNGLESLQLFTRFLTFTDTALPASPVQVVDLGDTIELRWPKVIKNDLPERIECLNAIFLGNLRILAGPSVAPRCVRAAHGPDAKRREAEQYYGCEVEWNAPDDAVVFEREMLLAPLPGAQPGTVQALVAFVEQKLVGPPDQPFVARLRQVLEAQLARGNGTQAAVARALGMSVRGLQRALQQSGLRYGDVLGHVLLRVATSLMRDRRRSLKEIAASLGYSEISSFSRTWKRLTGESPARYRARALGLPTTRDSA